MNKECVNDVTERVSMCVGVCTRLVYIYIWRLRGYKSWKQKVGYCSYRKFG